MLNALSASPQKSAIALWIVALAHATVLNALSASPQKSARFIIKGTDVSF